jgi:tyrosinase
MAISSLPALTPFSNGQTTFWPSASTVNTGQLGYSYPDFNGLDMGNQAAVRAAISRRVNQLYGVSVFGAAVAPPPAASASALTAATTELTQALSVAQSPADKQQPLAAAAAVPSPKPTPATRSVPGGHGHAAEHVHHHGQGQSHHTTPPPVYAPPNRGLYDWTARIECKKFELSSSYSVLIFLGDVPADVKDWQVSPNYVGSHYAFVNSAAEECANCRDQADLIVEGFVHLNQAIVKHSGLHSLEPDSVVPYLSKNLHWRVLKVKITFSMIG